MKRSSIPRVAVVSFAVLLAACSDGTAPRAHPRSIPLVGNSRPEIDLIARELSTALKDPAFRRGFRAAMTGSQRPERRVLIDELVALPGAGQLRTRLEEARRMSANLAIAQFEDGCANGGCDGPGGTQNTDQPYPQTPPPIEAYMPVEEHEAAWSGNQNDVLTLPQPEDENAAIVIAYDANNNPVELQGGDSAPTVPVISVGYSEVPASLPAGYTPPTQVFRRGIGVREYITKMRALNDHEPWFKGKPEFELLLAGAKDGGLDYKREMPIPPSMWSWKDSENARWRSTPGPLPLETWDTTVGSRVKVQCIEHDGSPFAFNFKVAGSTKKIIKGVPLDVSFSVDFKLDWADDMCGSSYITVMLTDGTWGRIPASSYDFEGTGDLMWYGHGLAP